MLSNLIKVLKALNSSQAPWQISLAVVFGMFLGLLPFFNFFSFLIIFLALIININLSIFILSTAIFKILGFILDPILNKIGHFILTSEPLIPIWTYIYNLPYARWTDFNNTVVMGSLVFSLIVSIPLFIILNKLIIKYREKISFIFNKFPILKALKVIDLAEKIKG